MRTYEEFLDSKTHSDNRYGFTVENLPDFLFDFQKELVAWALSKGRAAVFADCGLGKTPMQLVWADQVMRRANKPVLILTPLAVSYQTIREGEKFGIETKRSQDGKAYWITITNYQRLDAFNPADFCGVVCDESSILKSFDGALRNKINAFMRKVQFRLLCTATAAPNDYIELGSSSEAIGELGAVDMLNRFFKNDQNTSDTNKKWRGQDRSSSMGWRFKGHAEQQFWRWVCSWARAIRKPSDLGFTDGQFVLPPLIENEHIIKARTLPPGMLFHKPAEGLFEQRQERRRTVQERCEMAAAKVLDNKRSLVWCNLNDEGDLLESMIPDSVQVSGSDDDDRKEESFIAFADGKIDRLITKSSIAGWGLNFQKCHHVTEFPSHSFEQYYQGVRRCWRFGQTEPVVVDSIATEGDIAVVENRKRKAEAASMMFSALVEQMNNALHIDRSREFKMKETVPAWL